MLCLDDPQGSGNLSWSVDSVLNAACFPFMPEFQDHIGLNIYALLDLPYFLNKNSAV